MTRQLRSLAAVGFFLAIIIGEVRQDATGSLGFARVGSLERVMQPTGRRTAGSLSISVESRATRLENSRLPVTSRIGRPATILLILSPDPRRVGSFSSAPDACGAISEYERVVDEFYTREVFCVHHELERFNFEPRTHRRDTHIRGRVRPYSETSRDHSGGGDGNCGVHLSSPVQISSREGTCQTMAFVAVMAITKWLI
jgi:hypothetical protein